jgi:hypothetical protein
MKANRETILANQQRALGSSPRAAITTDHRFDDASAWWPASPDEQGYFCGECGQLLDARATPPTWAGNAQPWWAWALVTLGAALTIVFGLTALSSAREQASSEAIWRSLSAWPSRLEGPSSRQSALYLEVPLGAIDRYQVATQGFERARDEASLGLAALLLGVSLLVRRSAQQGATGYRAMFGSSRSDGLLGPCRRALFAGWALTETVALSAFRLIAMTFLYLLIARTTLDAPPTWNTIQETLDRVTAIIVRLTELTVSG